VKIVVISDTHGNYPKAIRAVELVERVDAIVHLGDFCDDVLPVGTAVEQTVIRVPGNCDAGSTLPRELFLRLGDVPVLLCHGDAYGVKRGVACLAEHADRIGARVVLFGHTHSPLVLNQDGLLLVNPGALAKTTAMPTFAVVTLQDGMASAEIISLPEYP
jgi:uncharacterized protein